jgi:predicted unusual protein kinase regulating ubiquinone biosynthesis (AarF/ABC1/UbiB family)
MSNSARGSDAVLTEKEQRKLEALVQELGQLKGLPMKFGQIVSYLEMDVPEQMRSMLSLLQTQSAATPAEQAEAILHEDLGLRGEALWAQLDHRPVAVASIGQVYRGRLRGSDEGLEAERVDQEQEIAVKLRHPGISDAIRSDFRFAKAAAGMGTVLMPGMGATARDFMAEMQARLLEECDYSLEAERQRLFAKMVAQDNKRGSDAARIVVPRVLEGYCGPRVLTSSWEQGEDFQSFCANASQSARNRAGAALFDFYIGTLYRHGLFHADPHPGNYLFRDDEVVVFDYGCVRVFEPAVVSAFAALAHAVRVDERAAVVDALRGLGAEPSKNDKAYEHLRGLLRSFFGPMLQPGAHTIESKVVVDAGRIARDKLALARLRLPGRLLFLFRIRFGLFAVLSRMLACNDWAALEQRMFEERGRVEAS